MELATDEGARYSQQGSGGTGGLTQSSQVESPPVVRRMCRYVLFLHLDWPARWRNCALAGERGHGLGCLLQRLYYGSAVGYRAADSGPMMGCLGGGHACVACSPLCMPAVVS